MNSDPSGLSLDFTQLQRIDQICASVEEALQQGRRVALREIVDSSPAGERSHLLLELLRLQLEYRQRIGESCEMEEYLREWPEDEATVRDAFAKQTTCFNAGSPTIVAHSLALPQRFGKYELLEVLGQGGMGVVYKAKQFIGQRQSRTVALKLIRPDRLVQRAGEAASVYLQRFREEALLATNLEHDRIVRVYEVGDENGQPYFSMQYIAGQSLADRVDAGPLPAREAATLLRGVAEAIAYAHQRGVVHRDIKPRNILLDEHGEPWVADFGLARESTGIDMSATELPNGTAQYMSPEQARGKHVGPAADIYGLGATLYELLTGRPPFHASSTAETLLMVLNTEPVAPRELNPKIPRDIETICLKCLDKDRARRYATASELAADLARFQDGRPTLARPVTQGEKAWRWCRRNPVLASLLATIATSLVVGISSTSFFAYLSGLNERKALNLAEEQVGLRNAAETKTDVAEQSLYLADLRLAGGATERREFGEVRSILGRHIPDMDRPDRRNWEWYYLLSKSQRRATTLYGHTGSVSAVAWNPAGNILASADSSGCVRLWSMERGDYEAIIDLQRHASALAWNGKGTQLAVGLRDSISILDVSSQRVLKTIPVAGRVDCLAWHADKPWLACGDDARLVTIRDLEQGNEVWKSPKGGKLQRLAWRPGRDHLLVTNWDHTATVWDIPANKIHAKFTSSGDGYFGASWNSTGTMLASSTSYFDYSVALFDLDTKSANRLSGHAAHVSATAFSPTDALLASASLDRTLRIWNVSQRTLHEVLDGHSEGINDVAWSSRGNAIASAGRDGCVVVWEMERGSDIPFELSGHKGIVRRLEWAPDSNRLATIGWDSVGRVWDVDQRKEIAALRGDITGGNNTICWDPQGKYIVTDDRVDGVDAVHVWDIGTKERVSTIVGLPPAIEHVRWSPKGEFLSVTGGGVVDIVNPLTGRKYHRLSYNDSRACESDFSPDSRELAYAGFRGTIIIVDVESGEQLRMFGNERTLENEGAITETLRWSPDGRHIATGNRDGHIHIRDAKTGDFVHVLKGHRGTVNGVRWSPDCARLASASHDGTVRIWDVRTGDEVLSLPGGVGILWSVAWSPNGERIAASSNNGHVLVWDATPGYDSTSRNIIPWWLSSASSAKEVTNIDPAAEVELPSGKHWHRYMTNFDTRVDPRKVSLSDQGTLALTWVYSPIDQRALLRLGHSQPIKLLVNGKQVFQGAARIKAFADQIDQEIQFRKGWNQLALQMTATDGDGSFYLRVANADPAHPIRGLRFSHDRRSRQLPDQIVKPRSKEDYREAPEWFLADAVLGGGGTVEVEGRTIVDQRELPQRRFNLQGLSCPDGFAINPYLADKLSQINTLRRIKILAIRPDKRLFERLATLATLEEVDLSGSNLSDASLSLLSPFENLQSLNISDTAISARGLEELKASLPKVHIVWNARAEELALATRLSKKNAVMEIAIAQRKLQLTPAVPIPDVPFRIVSIKAEEKPGLTAADFDGIEKLDALESISLLHTRVGDEVLEKLKGQTKLRYLGCGNTSITGKPLANFSPMPKVEKVVFGGSLASENVAHLDKFPNVKTALLGWTALDDSALDKLPTLPQLHTLSLERTKIQGAGLSSLNRLPKLRSLNLSHTAINDGTFQKLPALSTLNDLLITDVALTDAIIPHLAKFKSLRKLNLSNTGLTRTGVDTLQKALPSCSITWSPTPVKPKDPPEETVESLSTRIGKNPADLEAWARRATLHHRKHQWKQAADDYQEVVRLAPEDLWKRQDLAITSLAAGREDVYLEQCREIEKRLAAINEPNVLHTRAARILALRPGAVSDAEEVLAMAKKIADDKPQWWSVHPQVPLLYRLERYDDAMREAGRIPLSDVGDEQLAPLCAWQAMIHGKLGRSEEARAALEKAKQHLPGVHKAAGTASGDHHNLIEAIIILREAEAVVNSLD